MTHSNPPESSVSPPEEALAALAGQHVVVPARGLVAAHHAQVQALGHLLLPLGELLDHGGLLTEISAGHARILLLEGLSRVLIV